MKTFFKYAVSLILAIACGLAFGAFTAGGERWGADNINRHFTKQVWVDGAAHIDGTATLAAPVFSGDVTLENSEKISNGTDNTVNVIFGGATSALGSLNLQSASASPADNDILTLGFVGLNDQATPTALTYAKILCTATDVTSNTADSTLAFQVNTAGTTPATAATLSGAALTLASGVGIVAPGGATIGGGTNIAKPLVGTVSFPNGSTTASLSISGLTSSYKLTMTPNTAYSGSVYFKYAVPGTGAATVAFSGDPGTTVTMAYVAVLTQ